MKEIGLSTAISTTFSVSPNPHIPKFPDEDTPGVNELMAALGKVIVALNVLDFEIKAATAFVLNPINPDLMHPEITTKRPLEQRADFLATVSRNALGQNTSGADKLKAHLDLVSGLARIRNKLTHSFLYRSGNGFMFQKFEKKFESRVATADDLTLDSLTLLAWTMDFANLFGSLFPNYSSWYIRQTTPD